MADLLDQLALLDWLPGETLFSLVSRLHRFWGFPLSRQTCEALFGHAQQGSQHDFPSRLATFVSRTNSRYGAESELSDLHTLLAYYRPFTSESVFDSVVRSMSAENVSHLKLKLGILTSRFRANHPLKACPQCMIDDVNCHGWSYWHLGHQFPGVWVCLQHGRWLEVSSLKATGVSRFQWVLPSDADLREVKRSAGCGSEDRFHASMSLARLITDVIASSGQSCYTMNSLEQVYRGRLSEIGWLRAGGSLRLSGMSESYIQHMQMLSGCPDIPADMSDPDKAAVQLGRIFRGARSGTHPLRHFLIIHWLFREVAQFAAAYERLRAPNCELVGGPQSRAKKSIAPTRVDDRHRQLRDLLASGDYTLSGAARRIGVDPTTAMAWAAKMRITVPRRPKALKEETRSMAIALLRSGAEKSDVAIRSGVSIQTITRLILGEVGLHQQWREARYVLVRGRNRAAWLSLIQHSDLASVKLLRALNPSVFMWLYRNDSDWLNENKPKATTSHHSGEVSRVDWDSRDQALSNEVLVVASQLAESRPGKSIKLWQVYQELPELKAKLGALNWLPLTRKALETVILTRKNSGDSLID